MKWSGFRFIYPFIILLWVSCTNNEQHEYQAEDISEYFNEIALGYEYGGSSPVVRKWTVPMRIYIENGSKPRLRRTLKRTISEINELVSDGFHMELVNEPEQANCTIFFGSNKLFLRYHPKVHIGVNKAVFNVWWENNCIYKARIFINTSYTTRRQQKSLIVEEITQVLGLGKDSDKYPGSIFYETENDGGYSTSFSPIDKALIRTLYHQEMKPGFTKAQVDSLYTANFFDKQLSNE